jgi:hypothetical protein
VGDFQQSTVASQHPSHFGESFWSNSGSLPFAAWRYPRMFKWSEMARMDEHKDLKRSTVLEDLACGLFIDYLGCLPSNALLSPFYFPMALSGNTSNILHSALLHITSRPVVYRVETV